MLTLQEIVGIQHHYERYKHPRSEIEAQVALDAMNKIFDDRNRSDDQVATEFEPVEAQNGEGTE